MTRSLLLAGLAALLAAAPAHAASIVSPAEGATVASRPAFTFDWPGGGFDASVTVELSEEPELLTAGDREGHFVDRGPEDTFFRDTDGFRPEEARPWKGGRLNAGTYYMRGFFKTYGGEPESMTPVMRITVRDEPIVLEGWLVRSRAMKRTRGCAHRRRLTGTFVYDDNAKDEAARWVVRARIGSKTVVRGRGETFDGTGRFNVVACLKRRTTQPMQVTLALVDAADQVTVSEPRTPGA